MQQIYHYPIIIYKDKCIRFKNSYLCTENNFQSVTDNKNSQSSQTCKRIVEKLPHNMKKLSSSEFPNKKVLIKWH